MRVHAISTGRVKITRHWQVGHGPYALRVANSLLDPRFTPWLPIHAWVIEHPEGLIVVDTGIPASANDPVYFPPFMPLVRRAARFEITPEQEIGPQLRVLGFAPEDVRWVVETHLHQDHDGGLRYFPRAEILVGRDEWNAAQGLKGQFAGYLNWRWPKRLAPTLVDFGPDGAGLFRGRYTLTQTGDVHLVPTPGHSRGHLSVVLEEGDGVVFIAGDASYTQGLLLAGQVDGVAIDAAAQRETHRRILNLAAQRPVVYLPSHDPDSARRLAEREPVPVGSLERA